jgi:serine/threonine-protein kinase
MNGAAIQNGVASEAGNVGTLTPSEPRLQVALVAGSGPSTPSGVASLLRGRLGTYALIATGLFTYTFITTTLPRVIRTGHLTERFFTSGVVLLVTMGVVWRLLGSVRPLSMRGLRAMEWLLFGSIAARTALRQHQSFTTVLAAWGSSPEIIHDAFTAPAVQHWMFLIFSYGIFIPNTFRRAVLVIGLMVLCPLLVGLSDVISWTSPGGPSLIVLWPMVFPLVGSALVAIFGSHRLNILEREARELGQYRLTRHLGSGGMGEVYMAEHVLLRRPCAIKLIRPERAVNTRELQRFEREVRATARLTHWNTVEIYDYGHAEDGTFYYAMEYLPGLSLQDLVDQHGPLPPGRAIHLLRQVCRALNEAHANGLIHRDIKPSNIIACERGGVHDVAKLLDFGLVQVLEPEEMNVAISREGTIRGTPSYMSPEQAAGDLALDAKSDIYGLGGVAYFLLTGNPPFVRETTMRTLAAHIHRELPPRHGPDAIPECPCHGPASDPLDKMRVLGDFACHVSRMQE